MRWPSSPGRRSRPSASSAGPRPPARAASTSTSASSPAGRSTRCAVPRWPWPAMSSGAHRPWPPPSGGRRSATASSSTTTRTPVTAPSPLPTPSGRRRMRASPCRWTGPSSRRWTPPTSPWPRFPRSWPGRATVGRASTRRPGRWRHSWSWPPATRRRAWAMRPGHRTTASRPVSRRGCDPPSAAHPRPATGSRLRRRRRPPVGGVAPSRSSRSRVPPAARTPWTVSSAGRRATRRRLPTSSRPTSLSIPCAAAPRPGRASASTSSTSRSRFAHPRGLWTLTTIPGLAGRRGSPD